MAAASSAPSRAAACKSWSRTKRVADITGCTSNEPGTNGVIRILNNERSARRGMHVEIDSSASVVRTNRIGAQGSVAVALSASSLGDSSWSGTDCER